MLILTDVQQVTLTVRPVSKAGNPAPVHGAPIWTSSAPDVLTIEPASDGLSALVKTTGTLGLAQVQVQADADLDEGEERHITGVLDVDVRASEAVNLAIEAGEPTDRE